MIDYARQEEYYNKAMKKFIEAGNDFQKLTPENKDRFIRQLVGTFGTTEIFNLLRNIR